ncbi:MAG: hypothetical protein ABI042_09595 [Verrucomicrobiota bacterium]
MNTPLAQNQATPPKRKYFRLWMACLCMLPVLIWAGFWLGDHVGRYLFLCYIYGFSRVRTEGLHFLSMPKNRPWPVSNGDKIEPNTHGFEFIISLACSITLVLAFIFLLRMFMKFVSRLGSSDKTPNSQIA